MQLAGGVMEAAKQRSDDLNVGCSSWHANKRGLVPEEQKLRAVPVPLIAAGGGEMEELPWMR